MRKQVKVVMLPTKKAHNLCLNEFTGLHYENPLTLLGNSVSQHLYLVSNERIKKDDWFVYNSHAHGTILKQAKEINDGLITCTDLELIIHGLTIGKIIATTDESLKIKADVTNANVDKYSESQVPQIPKSFVKAYVEADGEIDNVMVEYDKTQCLDHKNCKIPHAHLIDKLKLRQDNTVIIHKKIYTRKEVETLLMNAFAATWNFTTEDYDSVLKQGMAWIKENL